MAKKKKTFADALNDQIANEFAAAMQYIGIAVHYDSETLPRLASFFYRQALEERSHAMMMVQYLLDVDEPVQIPGIADQQSKFDDDVEPGADGAGAGAAGGRGDLQAVRARARAKDFRAEQFMQWFVKEQVEEVSLMTDLLNVVERSGDNLLLVEDFIAREALGEGGETDAPPEAGGG